jgi:Ras GTPase-activating protein-binding protein 1
VFLQAIKEKIMGVPMTKAEIKSVDSQESLGGGYTVLVRGHLTGGDGVRREFMQFFFLAPQEKGYFVLNDMLRYVEEGLGNPIPAPTAAEVQLEVVDAVPPPLANGTAGAAVEPAAPDLGACLVITCNLVQFLRGR